MEIPDYKPNSNKYRSEQSNKKGEERVVEKVIVGGSGTRKKSATKKLLSGFFENDKGTVTDYVVNDILVPNFKRIVYEMITSATGMSLGIDDRRSRTTTYGGTRTSYDRYYDDRRSSNSRRGDVYDYDDVTFDQRGDANKVLNILKDEIQEYGEVSVGILYSLAGQPTRSTDFEYGWTSLTERNSGTIRNRDGSYSLDLPRAIPIN